MHANVKDIKLWTAIICNKKHPPHGGAPTFTTDDFKYKYYAEAVMILLNNISESTHPDDWYVA